MGREVAAMDVGERRPSSVAHGEKQRRKARRRQQRRMTTVQAMVRKGRSGGDEPMEKEGRRQHTRWRVRMELGQRQKKKEEGGEIKRQGAVVLLGNDRGTPRWQRWWRREREKWKVKMMEETWRMATATERWEERRIATPKLGEGGNEERKKEKRGRAREEGHGGRGMAVTMNEDGDKEGGTAEEAGEEREKR